LNAAKFEVNPTLSDCAWGFWGLNRLIGVYIDKCGAFTINPLEILML
jgi:hypothetical protein